MRTLRDIQVGVRLPSVVAFALVTLWFLSVWFGEHAGKGFVADLSMFWVSVFMLAPLIAPVFAALALFIHFRTVHRHRIWAYLALLASVTPWLYFSIIGH